MLSSDKLRKTEFPLVLVDQLSCLFSAASDKELFDSMNSLAEFLDDSGDSNGSQGIKFCLDLTKVYSEPWIPKKVLFDHKDQLEVIKPSFTTSLVDQEFKFDDPISCFHHLGKHLDDEGNLLTNLDWSVNSLIPSSYYNSHLILQARQKAWRELKRSNKKELALTSEGVYSISFLPQKQRNYILATMSTEDFWECWSSRKLFF